MPTPKKPPTSVRLTDQNEAEIAAVMAKSGWKKNLTITNLIHLGAHKFREAGQFVVAPGPAPDKLAEAHKAVREASVALKAHLGKDGVQVGIKRPAAGALLDRKKRWRV